MIQSIERAALHDELWRLARSRARILDLTTAEIAVHGGRSLVWDASAMPAGGHYFPIYARLLAQLEARGDIDPARHVLVETTTGTAGMALGWLARRLGYRLVLFMPEDMPAGRIAAVRAELPEGSELRLTPAGEYVGGMVRTFRRYLALHRDGLDGLKLYPVDHSRRPEAVEALTGYLRDNVISRLPSKETLSFAVGALGNGTSSSALFTACREIAPQVIRVGVEPSEAPVAFLRKHGDGAFADGPRRSVDSGPHALLGTGGWGVTFPFLDVDEIDCVFPVGPDAWRARQAAFAGAGMDLGNSSAACQSVVHRLLSSAQGRGLTALSILYDRLRHY